MLPFLAADIYEAIREKKYVAVVVVVLPLLFPPCTNGDVVRVC